MTNFGGNNFFTANKLKALAMVLMFIDHFALIFLPANTVLPMLLRFFGRIVAPVICFFIAEGYCYTSNRAKYIARLLILALVSHVPFNIAFGLPLSPLKGTSVIWALALGLIAVTALKSATIRLPLKLAILIVCCAASYTANWNFVAVLWIAAFGFFHGNFRRQMLAFCVIGMAFHLSLVYYRFGFSHWYQLGIFLAIPLLALYNGKLGQKSKVLASGFYVFYPLHLLVLYLLDIGTPLKEIISRLLS